jgi:hypothetical protein
MKIVARQKLKDIAEMLKNHIKDELVAVITENDTSDVHNISTQIELVNIDNLPTSEDELRIIEDMIENDIVAYHETIAMAYAYVKMDNKYIYLDLDVELEEDDEEDSYRNDSYYGDDDDDEGIDSDGDYYDEDDY